MKTKNKIIKIVTHDGSFHSDDVFAAATLSLYFENKKQKFKIKRTRDEDLIKEADYVFDVGGKYDPKINRFDHHQKGFNEKGKSGIICSSFGLVWKKFGKELCGSRVVAEILEKKLVAPIDAYDNGIDLVLNKYEVSPYFIQHFFLAMRSSWKEGILHNEKMFFESVDIAKKIITREIIQITDELSVKKDIQKIYKNTKDKRIIVLNKNYPFEDLIISFKEPIFVIYPRTSDKYWGVKSVRNNPKSFKNRKDFPKKWAGLLNEDLQKVTGVKDAIFCHRGLFMAVAKTKEGAIKLAKLALDKTI